MMFHLGSPNRYERPGYSGAYEATLQELIPAAKLAVKDWTRKFGNNTLPTVETVRRDMVYLEWSQEYGGHWRRSRERAPHDAIRALCLALESWD